LAGYLVAAVARRPPCLVQLEAGIISPHRGDTYYQADMAVSCQPHATGQYPAHDPILIVEVLSPTTEEHDRKAKVPDYRLIASVMDVLLVDPARIYCEVYRRLDRDRWLVEQLREPEQILRLDSV